MNVSTIASIAGACISVGGLVIALLALRTMRRWRTQYESLESRFAAVRRELELVASISVRTGRRVQRVEHAFSGVTDRIDVVESREAMRSESLDLAIDSARHGADAGRLEQQFGLSSGEAELVTRLHGRTKEGLQRA